VTKHDLSLRAGNGGRAADLLAYRTLRASVGLPRLTSLGLIGLGLLASWLCVYAAGGAGALAPHLYYLPILFAATRFGPVVALCTGLAAMFLAGPMTPEFTATGEPQDAFQWLTRGALFIGIGQLSAWLLAPSIRPITEELHALQLEHRIRHALTHDEFRLVYQPIYSISSSRYVGVEALIRWEHPVHGNIPPDQFMGVAEETDLIHEITDFVLDQACRAASEWRNVALAQGRPPFHVAVNLSARDMERPELARTIETVLERHQLPAELLHLELTESVLAFEGTGFQLRQLKKLGITLSIDDFGTGYSSLSYLDRFPFDIIKIDRSLIANLGPNASSQSLARGMIALSGSLEMLTIAEGIETREQLAIVHDIGFDLVQGFLFSRPRPHTEIPALVTASVDPLQMRAESAREGNES
jgi:EAL domain-containing protein (putative c-di-GMP-specific phosphodiesterase class I)